MIIYTFDGMPTFVPSESAAASLISKGYSYQPLTQNEIKRKVDSKVVTDTKEKDDLFILNINTAIASEIMRLDGVGVSISKKIVAMQPKIKSIDDLSAIAPNVEWGSPTIDDNPISFVF